MACYTEANQNNFVRWKKISGSLSLADLQANGLPDVCDFTTIVSISNLTASTQSTSEILLTWGDESDVETSYKVYRSLSEETGYSLVQTLSPDVVTWLDSGLTINTLYYYKVESVGQVSVFSDPVSAFTGGLGIGWIIGSTFTIT